MDTNLWEYHARLWCLHVLHDREVSGLSQQLFIESPHPPRSPPDNQEVLSNMILDGSSFGTGFLCWPRSIEVCSLMIPSSVKAGAAT